MTCETTVPDEPPEPYLLKGEHRYRTTPQWHWRIQRPLTALARCLDEWHQGLGEAKFETFNSAGFCFRDEPLTAVRLPLSVVAGQLPALDSDWVPVLPLVAVEVSVDGEEDGPLAERVEEYLSCGVAAVWVLRPGADTVTVHRVGTESVTLDADATLSGEPELPGFMCRVADLFI